MSAPWSLPLFFYRKTSTRPPPTESHFPAFPRMITFHPCSPHLLQIRDQPRLCLTSSPRHDRVELQPHFPLSYRRSAGLFSSPLVSSGPPRRCVLLFPFSVASSHFASLSWPSVLFFLAIRNGLSESPTPLHQTPIPTRPVFYPESSDDILCVHQVPPSSAIPCVGWVLTWWLKGIFLDERCLIILSLFLCSVVTPSLVKIPSFLLAFISQFFLVDVWIWGSVTSK